MEWFKRMFRSRSITPAETAPWSVSIGSESRYKVIEDAKNLVA